MSGKKLNQKTDFSELQHVVNNILHFAQTQVENLQGKFQYKQSGQLELRQIAQKIFQTSRVINYFAETQNLLKNQNHCESTKLEVAVERAIFQLSWELERRGFPIKSHITQKQKRNSSYSVRAIPYILELVIAELLENAVVFGDGLVSLIIRDKVKTVSLKVSNRGKLSPAEIRIALTKFKSFGDNAGSGLGLSLVQAFATAVKGKFRMTSGRGMVNVELELKKQQLLTSKKTL